GSNFMQWEGAQKCTDILKTAGYNYTERLYEQHHAEHPDWAIYGSETSSVVQSRGIYHFPLEEAILCDDDEQCSALGNSSPAWAAKETLACIIPDRDADFCAGQFIWTGFDYIGEPTPYSTKNSYFGQIDTAGFEKDSFYIFKAEWTDYKKQPFIHIYPYWDFNEGQDIDIRVVSNAPFIRLFFNGVLIGEKALDHINGKSLILDVKRPYETGTLTAAAYDENGSEIARDEKCSFGDAYSLALAADKMTANADGEELFFISISAADKNGIPVSNAVSRVNIEVSGEGRLIGLDNGDSTDYEQYKTTSRRLFSGRLLAIIAATKNAGWIKVKATSPGLKGAELELMTIACTPQEGISANDSVSTYQPDFEKYGSEIPVRKIELTGGRKCFDKEHDTLKFKTVCKPENATYKSDITYRLTTVSGIDTNIAEITEQTSEGVTIKCKGDGEVYLRALCKNGKHKPSLISVIKLTAQGLGQASFDAYSTIAGGLFTKGEKVTTGIERGLSIMGGKGSYGAFENVDFGKFGSDKINLPIYMLRSTPVKFDIIDGIPGSGEVIGSFENTKESSWLRYNDEVELTLTKKLTGIHTISISSNDNFEIRSIRFTKPDKEFSQVNASLYSNIYGDSFTLGNDEITHIGNNVVIDYGEFDFGDRQPTKLMITGRSALDNNSIHFKFTNSDVALTLCEFAGCDDYTERAFDISGISGNGSVSFTFLPGTDFDLKAFRFE
ncbi:MAG: DUF4982 domain-containing protein, partial [Ruminococcus sp.]|nr:DUF4982 domain-containing protein [Ruminococcus sp.]